MNNNSITIHNIKLFDRLLFSVLKMVEMCEFKIGPKGCKISSINDSRVTRAFFETNAITCDENISFAIGDLSRLHKSIRVLNDFKKDDKLCKMTYDGVFLKMDDIVNFKLHSISSSRIEKYIDPGLKTKLQNDFSMVLTNVMMKKLCSMAFITSDESPKIYIYKKGDSIVGEIDDKTKERSDSIQIPISSEFDGQWITPIITKIDFFRNWNLLDASKIIAIMTKQKVMLSVAQITEGDTYIKSKIISSVIKR